jgi:hypothetical protein
MNGEVTVGSVPGGAFLADAKAASSSQSSLSLSVSSSSSDWEDAPSKPAYSPAAYDLMLGSRA